MTTRIWLVLGISKAFESLSARPREEDDEQDGVHDAARSDVEPDAGDGVRGVHARLLQEPNVQRHAADVRGRHPVHERGGQLRAEVREERQGSRDATHECDRRRDVGAEAT